MTHVETEPLAVVTTPGPDGAQRHPDLARHRESPDLARHLESPAAAAATS
jgi:hypothetical protein